MKNKNIRPEKAEKKNIPVKEMKNMHTCKHKKNY